MSRTRTQSRLRERSFLLNPAPVVGAALAAFAIAFGGLTMRLATGHDPAVAPLASASRAAGGGRVSLRTSSSRAAATGSAATAGGQTTAPRLATTASGARQTATVRGQDG